MTRHPAFTAAGLLSLVFVAGCRVHLRQDPPAIPPAFADFNGNDFNAGRVQSIAISPVERNRALVAMEFGGPVGNDQRRGELVPNLFAARGHDGRRRVRLERNDRDRDGLPRQPGHERRRYLRQPRPGRDLDPAGDRRRAGGSVYRAHERVWDFAGAGRARSLVCRHGLRRGDQHGRWRHVDSQEARADVAAHGPGDAGVPGRAGLGPRDERALSQRRSRRDVAQGDHGLLQLLLQLRRQQDGPLALLAVGLHSPGVSVGGSRCPRRNDVVLRARHRPADPASRRPRATRADRSSASRRSAGPSSGRGRSPYGPGMAGTDGE